MGNRSVRPSEQIVILYFHYGFNAEQAQNEQASLLDMRFLNVLFEGE